MRGSYVLLTGTYFNLKISLLGGPYYYPALHNRTMGTGKLRAWPKVSQQMGCVHPAGQGVRISTSIPQSRRGDPFQPKGVTQIAAQAPSTRRTLLLPSSQQWELTTG